LEELNVTDGITLMTDNRAKADACVEAGIRVKGVVSAASTSEDESDEEAPEDDPLAPKTM
jgi:hypothetical protein